MKLFYHHHHPVCRNFSPFIPLSCGCQIVCTANEGLSALSLDIKSNLAQGLPKDEIMSHNMSPALENERAALASLIQAYSCCAARFPYVSSVCLALFDGSCFSGVFFRLRHEHPAYISWRWKRFRWKSEATNPSLLPSVIDQHQN